MIVEFYTAGKEKAQKDFKNTQFLNNPEWVKKAVLNAPNPHWAIGYVHEYLTQTGQLTPEIEDNVETYLQTPHFTEGLNAWKGVVQGIGLAAIIPALVEGLLRLQPTPFKGQGNVPHALGASYIPTFVKAFDNKPFESSRKLITRGEKAFIDSMKETAASSTNRVLLSHKALAAFPTLAGSIATSFIQDEKTREYIPTAAAALASPLAGAHLFHGIRGSRMGGGWQSLAVGAGKAAAAIGTPYFITKGINKVHEQQKEVSKADSLLTKLKGFL